MAFVNGCAAPEFSKQARKIQRIRIPEFRGHLADGQIGFAQQMPRSLQSQPLAVLLQGFAHLRLEQMTQPRFRLGRSKGSRLRPDPLPEHWPRGLLFSRQRWERRSRSTSAKPCPCSGGVVVDAESLNPRGDRRL